MSAEPAKKRYTGSCSCQKIRYEVNIALPTSEAPTASRCNCTICQKTGFTSFRVDKPKEDFKLISPSSVEELKDYQSRITTAHRYFCENCGTHVYAEGYYEFNGQKVDFFTINLLTFDQPQEGLDLSKFKFNYFDGRNDNWTGGLKDEPWAGGAL